MSGKPAARVTDPTACPLPGHATNPIVSGSPDVMFEGLQAARLNDATACGGHIASGVSSTVFINGQPAAMLGMRHRPRCTGHSGREHDHHRRHAHSRALHPDPVSTRAILRALSIDQPGNRQAHGWPQGQGLLLLRHQLLRHHGCRGYDPLGQG